MAYKVTIKNITSDGANYYTEAEIFDGREKTYPLIRPSFPIGTSASEIDSYFQTVANASPTLATAIADLVGKTYTGA